MLSRFPGILQVYSQSDVLLFFVTMLTLTSLSVKTIAVYVRGVITRLKLSGVQNPVSNFILSHILKGAFKKYPTSKRLRIPVSLDLLTKLVNSARVIFNPYEAKLMSAIMSLAFHGLLRIGECCHTNHVILLDNVQVYVNTATEQLRFATITFITTKTDQLGVQGQWTWVQETQQLACPIANLLQYLKVRPQTSVLPDLFVNSRGKPFTKTQFANRFVKLLKAVEQDTDSFKSHSLRIGGATHLYLMGWSVDQIKAKGRWRSTNVAKLYCNA